VVVHVVVPACVLGPAVVQCMMVLPSSTLCNCGHPEGCCEEGEGATQPLGCTDVVVHVVVPA
jgi:hypothetical protein